MSNMVTIKINGEEHKVPEGMNLIDAAETVGVHIPNLCYLKGMKGIGACRMCLIESGGRSMIACIMKTKEGMDVVTENEKISQLRKFVIDLILSMHPLDCMTCTKAGVCDLQKYAYDLEIKESSFSRKSFNFSIDEGNPFIKRDPDYCVLCGRCVRVCKEQGTSVLDFMGRGVGSKVTTADDKPLQESGCTFCGACVDVCPVNALLEADRWRKGREWEYNTVNSVCLSCGNACSVKVCTSNGDIVKINAGSNNGRVDKYICAIGRYGFDSLKSDVRVTGPMKKVDGSLKETSWEDALAIAAEKLKQGDAGIISNASLTNEDTLTLSRLAENTGVSNTGTTVSLYADNASLIGPAADINDADLLVVAGLNPSQWKRNLPALDAIVRRKIDRKVKVIVLNSEDTGIADAATIALKGDESVLLKSLAKSLIDKGESSPSGIDLAGVSSDENTEKAAELYKEASNPMIIASPSLFEAAQSVAAIKGSVLSAPLEANARGTILMGLKESGKGYSGLVEGGVKTLYAVGELPFEKRPSVDFLIVQSSYLTDIAKEADLLLPANHSLETNGSIVDYMGAVKELACAAESPVDSKPNSEIFMEIAKKSGNGIAAPNTEEIKGLADVKAELTVKPFSKRSDLASDMTGLCESMNKPVINGSRLLWLKETEAAVSA